MPRPPEHDKIKVTEATAAVEEAIKGEDVDVIAFFALVFGLLGGYILKKTRSLYPVLAAHILFNLINVAIYIL